MTLRRFGSGLAIPSNGLAILLSAMAVALMVSPPPAVEAADISSRLDQTRNTLERLLACHETKKANAVRERDKIAAHLQEAGAFRSELTDAPQHRLAVLKADEALAKDREGLAKAEERVRLAEIQLRMTLNAMKYLPPHMTDLSPGTIEQGKRLIADWLAQFYPDNADAADAMVEKENGFLSDPIEQKRLEAALARIQAVSPHETTPVTMRIVDKPTGRNAISTATTIYVERGYLDRLKTRYKDPKAQEEQLLVTMGHELAHIQLHHVNLGFIQGDWQRRQNERHLTNVEGSHPAYADPNGVHDDAAFRAQLAEYQRGQEFQADLLGAQLALAAGVSPLSIKESFTRMWFEDMTRRLELDQKGVEPHYNKMIEDHPRPNERLKALEESLGEKFWEKGSLHLAGTCL